MSLFQVAFPGFAPSSGMAAGAGKAGVRLVVGGVHTSRTIMLAELSMLLAAVPAHCGREGYKKAIVGENVLGKSTASTRRLSDKRLGELYALDSSFPLFRILRRLWDLDPASRPQLALLASLSRDRLLRASAPAVLLLVPGDELRRDAVRDALLAEYPDRLNDNTLEKVLRNTASSWTQAGHLEGRTFKRRRRVEPTPASLSLALWLGHVVGFRGADLLRTGWVTALDCAPDRAQELAVEAKRLGLIDVGMSEQVMEFAFGRLDPMHRRR